MSTAPNRIAEFRKAKKLSQAQLGDLIGTHWVTISRLERGKMQLTGSRLDQIAKALGIDPSDLLKKTNTTKIILVAGIINSDGHVIKLDEKNNGRNIPLDWYDDSFAYWLECLGDALYPLINEHDLLKMISVHEDDWNIGIGRMCHARLASGENVIGILGVGSDDEWTIALPGGRPRQGLKLQSLGVLVQIQFAVPGINATPVELAPPII